MDIDVKVKFTKGYSKNAEDIKSGAGGIKLV